MKQAEAELGQAQHNWKLGFAEAEVGAELGNKNVKSTISFQLEQFTRL